MHNISKTPEDLSPSGIIAGSYVISDGATATHTYSQYFIENANAEPTLRSGNLICLEWETADGKSHRIEGFVRGYTPMENSKTEFDVAFEPVGQHDDILNLKFRLRTH